MERPDLTVKRDRRPAEQSVLMGIGPSKVLVAEGEPLAPGCWGCWHICCRAAYWDVWDAALYPEECAHGIASGRWQRAMPQGKGGARSSCGSGSSRVRLVLLLQ